jgi:hypothetical protein
MILDVFTIMFEADTSKAKGGVDETRKSTDELVDSMKKADDQAAKTGSSMAGFAAKALGALTAAVSIGQTIRGAIDRAGMVHLMNQTSESIGVAVEDMDAFRRAVEDTGGTAQGAEQTFVKMAESIGQALSKTESEQAKTFAALGVNLKDAEGNALNASDGILAVAGAIEGMDKAQARFTLKQLQITDPKTVELILKGRKEIENTTRAHKEQGVITKEMAIQAGKLDTAMNALRGGMERAGLGIMDALLPAIIKGVEWLTVIVDWAGEHKDFVVGFFAAIAAVVAAVYLPAMISAAAATLAATWPIIAIGAAIAAAAVAFALIYDDIMNFIDGNDSLIGQMVEKYPMVATMVDMVAAAFRTLMEWGGIAFDFLGKAVGLWADGMKMAFDGVVAYFKFVASVWESVFGGIMSGIGKISSGLSTVGGWIGIGSDDNPPEGQSAESIEPAKSKSAERVSASEQVVQNIEIANSQLAAAGGNPMNSISSSAISNTANNNREQNVQIGQVTVQTQATDSQGISQSISSDLSVQLKALEAESATGIDR